jgi:pentatricopeptide repeat protein
MSNFLLRIEAIESKILSHSCPRGTSSRTLSLRLKRRFQPPKSNFSSSTQVRVAEAAHGTAFYDTNLDGRTSSQSQPNDSVSPLWNLSPGDKSNGAELEGGPLAGEPLDTLSSLAQDKSLEGNLYAKTKKQRFRQLFHETESSEWGPKPEEVRKFTNFRNRGIRHPYWDSHREFKSSPEDLLQTLATKDAFLVLQEASSLSDWSSIDNETFSNILKCLDPEVLIDPYIELYKDIGFRNARYNPLKAESGIQRYVHIFLHMVLRIIRSRIKYGFEIQLHDYEHLLRCANAAGDPKLAKEIWSLMRKKDVYPNTACYNQFLGAQVWADAKNSRYRHTQRVLPRTLFIRSWDKPPAALSGHRTGEKGGLKTTVAAHFNQMMKDNVMGDEETFSILILAFAREGDLDSVKSLLMSIWAVDVNGLLTSGEESVQPVKEFPLDSPIRPTSNLLSALTYAFSINSAIPQAAVIVDFIARQYSLKLPDNVCEALIEFTYVQSTRRTAKNIERKPGLDVGSLHHTAVQNVWNTLTSPPHNYKPSLFTYNKYIRSLIRQQRFSEAQTQMEEARRIQSQAVWEWRLLACRLMSESYSEQKPTVTSRMLYDKSIRIDRNRQYLIDWSRVFLSNAMHLLGTHNLDFLHRGLQDFIKAFDLYLPRYIEYELPTGSLRFPSQSKALSRKRVRNFIAQNAERLEERDDVAAMFEKEIADVVKNTQFDVLASEDGYNQQLHDLLVMLAEEAPRVSPIDVEAST